MPICKLCGNAVKQYQKRCRNRCGSCNTKIRRFRNKMMAIRQLGGKCLHCGWSGDQAAFQFHHVNPEEKTFIIGNVGNKSWPVLQKELQKCILLCANCHMIQHSSKNTKKFLEAALQYKGKLFTV